MGNRCKTKRLRIVQKEPELTKFVVEAIAENKLTTIQSTFQISNLLLWDWRPSIEMVCQFMVEEDTKEKNEPQYHFLLNFKENFSAFKLYVLSGIQL